MHIFKLAVSADHCSLSAETPFSRKSNLPHKAEGSGLRLRVWEFWLIDAYYMTVA